MPTKLHELLAAESPLMTQATKTRGDLENTFEKKVAHFQQRRVTFSPVAEGLQPVVEDQLDLQTTIRKELAWIGKIMGAALDTGYQIDDTNTKARADVVLADDTVLLKAVPATALLRLEHRADELLQFVSKIPTMDPSKGFRPDGDMGEGVYVSRPDHKVRTQKVQEPLILVQATKEHPAQAQIISKDVIVGNVETIHWSALLTTAEKGEMLERVEKLRVAVKAARARANEQIVEPQKVAATLLGYVFNGNK